MEIITTCSALNPEILPPSERAAYYHSLRVHLQVTQWKHLDIGILSADAWGWSMQDGMFLPIKTDIDPAPEWLLNYVRCKCKATSRNPCSTQMCSCRKNGLKCVMACNGCHGEDCDNKSGDMENNETESDDDFERNIFDIFD